MRVRTARPVWCTTVGRVGITLLNGNWYFTQRISFLDPAFTQRGSEFPLPGNKGSVVTEIGPRRR
jgi:hypothetical protein